MPRLPRLERKALPHRRSAGLPALGEALRERLGAAREERPHRSFHAAGTPGFREAPRLTPYSRSGSRMNGVFGGRTGGGFLPRKAETLLEGPVASGACSVPLAATSAPFV